MILGSCGWDKAKKIRRDKIITGTSKSINGGGGSCGKTSGSTRRNRVTATIIMTDLTMKCLTIYQTLHQLINDISPSQAKPIYVSSSCIVMHPGLNSSIIIIHGYCFIHDCLCGSRRDCEMGLCVRSEREWELGNNIAVVKIQVRRLDLFMLILCPYYRPVIVKQRLLYVPIQLTKIY